MSAPWIDLVNSDWRDYRDGRREDRLRRIDWAARFLKTWGFDSWALRPESAHRSLAALRSLLRRLSESLDRGAHPRDSDLEALNEVLRAAPAHRRIQRAGKDYELLSESLKRGPPQVAAEIAASFAADLAGGGWRRIHLCQNRNCRWVFVDRSKNLRRVWCEQRTCGTLMRVRRYRTRHAPHGEKPEPRPE